MSPSCHTLSKALDISKNIPLTSLGGLQSKDTHMNQKVENLIGYHKEDNSLEGIQKWNYIRFSQKTLPEIGRSETGL